MKFKIIASSTLLLLLATGQVNAQMPGPTNGRPTESDTPMAPGNPNTSTTVAAPIISNDNDDNDTLISPTANTFAPTTGLNAITPSGGNTGASSAPQQ